MGFELQKLCPKMVSNWAVDELEEPPGRTGRVIPISSGKKCVNSSTMETDVSNQHLINNK